MGGRRLAVALVLGGLLAGCGSSGSSFKSDYAAEYSKLKSIGGDIATDIRGASSKTNAEVAKEFSGLADQVKAQESQVDALSPPQSAAKDFDTLKSSLPKVESDLRSISGAVASNDARAAKSATIALLHDSLDGKRAAKAVKRESGG